MALTQYDWILALITIAFCFSAFGNGANDVANSYATSVAARTLTMPQVGVLSICTEFIGAVALGARVTATIKNGIININRFNGSPGVLILAMACAETGSATWLMVATRLGFPVSTTQTIVGALVGVGFASEAPIKWAWTSGSVSQVAASWGISPIIAAAFSAIVFGTIKYAVLERRDSFKWGLRLIPAYLAFTAGILALFIVIEAPTAPSLEEFGAGKAAGIVLGCYAGVLLIAYVFFLPYFHRRLVKNDARLKWWHIPLGPTLWRENPWIPFPSNDSDVIIDHYESAYVDVNPEASRSDSDHSPDGTVEKGARPEVVMVKKKIMEPDERFLAPNRHLPVVHPQRLWGYVKWFFLQGVTRDCVTFGDERLHKTHLRAIRYDNKVEHLWTYAQVASAMIMSIAHGSNDVANAVGPWSAAYATYQSERVNTRSATPIWMLVVAGLLLGLGFWFYGYHIIRSLGNKITQVSPTRGFSMELGAAITVMLASRLGLPVSTTQCLTGATMGVALMNYDLGAVNWRQLLFILCGWILTLPAAGLISGLLMVMALNTPHF